MSEEPDLVEESNESDDSLEASGRKKFKVYAVAIACAVALTLVILAVGYRFLSRFERMNTLHSFVYTPAHAYADHNDGVYPPLFPESGKLMYDVDKVFPYYRWPGDPDRYLDPERRQEMESDELESFDKITGSLKTRFGDSFYYLGYMITNQKEADAFAAAYRKRVQAGLPLSDALGVPEGHGNFGGTKIYRIKRLSPDDAQQGIEPNEEEIFEDFVLFVEKPQGRWTKEWLVMTGGRYGEGDMEYLRYPGEFPMTEEFISLLEELERFTAEHQKQ